MSKNVELTHDYTLSEVPAEKRRSLVQTSSVWVGWCISLSAFLAGGIIGGGTTASTGLLAVLMGNLLLVIVASFIGLIGFKTGLTTYSISRIVFGRKGSVVTSLLIGILAMGFIGALLKSFGTAFNALIPAVPAWLAIVLFTCCVTLTAIYGYKGLVFISRIAAPALWIFLAIGLLFTFKDAGSVGAVFSKQPAEPIPFSTAMNAAIAVWITGATMVCDITRYAKKASHVVIGALVGYIGGAAVFEGASVLTAIGVGNPDVVNVMSSLGLLIPGVLILGLALWTTTDNNIYSSSLAFANFGEVVKLNISKTVWVLIAAAIALITALSGLVDQFINVLNFIGAFLPPFAGILITHFWILNRGKSKHEVRGNVRYSAFISWIIAILLAHFLTFGTPAFIGLVSAIVVYWILGKVMDKEEYTLSESRG